MKGYTKSMFCMVFIMICTLLSAQSWHIEYKTPDTHTQEQWIKAYFKIYNDSGTTVSLSDLTIRYWYTPDGTAGDVFGCWWAQAGSANVTGSFQDITPPLTGAGRYCEIGFTAEAGTLSSGTDSGEIQCAWHGADWRTYDETDDYSQDHTLTAYTTWDRVCLYLGGESVWGTEPGSGQDPTPEVTPETTTTTTPENTPTLTTPVDPTPTETATPTPSPTPEATPEQTSVPGTGTGILLEAEDYTGYSDSTGGNEGNTYRTDDVDIEPCAEGGYNVGWITDGEWLQYDLAVDASDIFIVYVRVASPLGKTDGFYIELDGTDVTGPVEIPNTGAWQSWQDSVIGGIPISAGVHTLRIVMHGDFNFNFIYLASETMPPGPTEPPGALPTSTPPPGYVSAVSRFGSLQVSGTQLSDQNGNPVRLKGMCSHGLQWFPFMKEHTIHNLVYDWNIQVIRPAMYIEDYKNGDYWGGYIAQPEYMKNKLIEMIDDALDAGIYILIDWHIHNDPTNFTSESLAFFEEMAADYGSYPNIIYEICNEPENVSWSTVKSYATVIIPAIRAIDPDNIIIVGTQNWCQDLDVAADDPLTGYTNIMYALHFYAGTHYQSIRDKADYALNSGLPVIVSEWGTSDSTGGSNGVTYFPESDVWVDWMNQRNLTWINWNFSNKSESSAALKADANIGGPWDDADLTASGLYIKTLMLSDDPEPTPTPTTPPEPTSTTPPEPTPTSPPDPTPTPQTGETCTPGSSITPDFVYDGTGDHCWEAASLGNYINSWNLSVLEVNGVDLTNQYAGAESLPPKIDGKYYVRYKCSVSWGHFEAKN
ncbi:MAG: cellulase family glycosylhydrolase [Spirochaetales bacterium]|nr:cellulase family glycosylhydrolase [Spirochaetales bacterium]